MTGTALANPDAVSLLQFKNGLKMADGALLRSWTCDTDNPCGQPQWRWVTCRGGRVVKLSVVARCAVQFGIPG